ncbi:MAG: sigma-70 family RNA polymerase sigma factor [Caldilineales bacterium]|nr:sigma-70 family RNA polymerase sigma factor [Caldilineales bacterium]MDW8318834.1 sigma-70 family RNA polymerase sigma factor [Anaerolineae bacterium]
MPEAISDLDILLSNEEALVAALHRGDPLGCTALVKRFGGQMYAVALRIVDDPDDAEEVLQDAFVTACRKMHTFEGRSKLSTWLYRVTTNAALMHLRKRRDDTVSLDEPQELDEGDVLPRQLGDWTVDPSQEALTGELRQVLEQAVRELPASLRAAFVLRDIQGLSTEEAAEALGITPGAVKVRLHRARLALRERLAGYLSEQPQPIRA